MRFKKVYIEISNICNLNCSFCPGTKRAPGKMGPDDFRNILSKLTGWTEFLYFHVMGEPLCHPDLKAFLKIAGDAGYKVILTTNGTLIPRQSQMLLSSPALHKVNISLHAFEANDIPMSFDEYLNGCFKYGCAASGKKLTVYRLWNHGGLETQNNLILKTMESYFPQSWKTEPRGTRIGDRVYLEYGDKFDWPDLSASEHCEKTFCYGLRDQIGVLCDGTVVPCCLDHEGDIALGNLLQQDMNDILETPRAKAVYQGFLDGNAPEALCKRCGYARRFRR